MRRLGEARAIWFLPRQSRGAPNHSTASRD
jgi:hypothetical protein